MTDMSEIARNSVLQSGFEAELKEEWLGKDFRKGMTHCDEDKTHVPLIRAKFRAEHLALEVLPYRRLISLLLFASHFLIIFSLQLDAPR